MTLFGFVRRTAAAALLLALAPTAASATSFWVKSGGGSSCTHTNLQAAIDAAQGNTDDRDVIYLVGSGPFTGPFTILAPGLSIIGGVPSCGSTISTQYSTVQAPSGKRPLTILVGDDGNIYLERLVITTNSGTLKSDGGGLWFAAPSRFSALTLRDCRVINNGTLNNGGGIFVSKGQLYLAKSSLVGSNTAANGGGIAAVNGANMKIDSSDVAANTAYFEGGGIYAPDASVTLGDFGGLQTTVANNIAGGDGGGFHIGPNAAMALGTVGFVSVTGNQALRGGGIFVNGSAVISRAEFSLNTASQAGGAVFVDTGGLLGNSINPATDGMPRFVRNKASQGAAIYAQGDQTNVSFVFGSFYDHDTRATGAAVLAGSGNLSAFLFQGVTIWGNKAPELFAVEAGAPLTLFHTSIAGNTLNRFVRWDGSGPGIRIANSAISETEPFFSGLPTPQVLPRLDCVASQSPLPLQSMPPGTDLSQVFVSDPQFAAPERGDFHVVPGSPAVDLCPLNSASIPNYNFDHDHTSRGFDEPFHANSPGRTYDAGVDELVPIVWDNFESGAFSHWATVAPGVPNGDNIKISTAARLGPTTSQRGLHLTLVNPSVQTPNNAYVWGAPSTPTGADLTRFNGSFFLDPQGLTMSSVTGSNRLRIFYFLDPNGLTRLMLSLVRSSADKWSLEVSYVPINSFTPVVAGSAFFACATFPCGNPADWRNNRIELEWRGGYFPAPLTIWRTRYINGLPDPTGRVQILSVNTPSTGFKINQALLGTLGDQFPGTSGQIFFDEVSFTY